MKYPIERPAKTEKSEFVGPQAADGEPLPLDGRVAEHCLGMLKKIGLARFQLAGKSSTKISSSRTRREARKWASAALKNTAVGTSAEASLWLFGLMADGMADRRVSQEVGQPVLSRMLVDALDLVDDFNFEAEIAESYRPQRQGT